MKFLLDVAAIESLGYTMGKNKPKVAPGRKNLHKPKPKGMTLLCQKSWSLKDKWLDRIRNGYPSAIWEFFDEFKNQLWTLCLATDGPELDKRLFYVNTLQSALEDIELFQQRGINLISTF